MCHRLLCYGDSNTYGYDPRSYLGGRYPESVRWTGLLRASGLNIVNKGENGRSIPCLDWEIESAARAVRRSKADVLVVMLGSNDLLQCPGLSAETCGIRMERFLSELLAKVQVDFEVLLVTPPSMTAGTWVSDQRTLEESRRLAGCYEMAARQLGIAFTDAGTWGVGLSYDGVHFSEEGHLAFAKGMQKALEALTASSTLFLAKDSRNRLKYDG